MYRSSWNFAGWCAVTSHKRKSFKNSLPVKSDMADSGSNCDFWFYGLMTLKFERPSFRNGVRYLNSFQAWCISMIGQCFQQIWCRLVPSLFKSLTSFWGHPLKPTKSCSKSSITQPRIDRSRSSLVYSLIAWHPIYCKCSR